MQKAINILKNGGVAVLPTDTIYGLSALALNKNAVQKIYDLKGRDENKPFIIAISSIKDLKKFNIYLNEKISDFLKNIWPNPVTVVLPIKNKNFEYLTHGSNSLAFRIPNYQPLLEILEKTGPLISTSANTSGNPPAKNIEEAKEYFGNSVDFYLDAGVLDNPPSTVIEIKDNKINILREGAFKINSTNLTD
jgi:L-threonylcarbamoyladenylate synthase